MNRIVPSLALVALIAAGCSSGDDPGAAQAAADGALAVTGTDALTFDPSALTTAAGTVTVELTAGSGVGHSFVVEGVNGDAPVVEVAAGETASGSVALGAGTYTVYCSIPGHRQAGMQTTLAVS